MHLWGAALTRLAEEGGGGVCVGAGQSGKKGGNGAFKYLFTLLTTEGHWPQSPPDFSLLSRLPEHSGWGPCEHQSISCSGARERSLMPAPDRWPDLASADYERPRQSCTRVKAAENISLASFFFFFTKRKKKKVDCCGEKYPSDLSLFSPLPLHPGPYGLPPKKEPPAGRTTSRNPGKQQSKWS